MSTGLAHVGVIRGRLQEARRKGLGPRETEEYVFRGMDLANLGTEDRRRLEWICKHEVWPVTRRKRRAGPELDQKELFA